MIETVTEAIKEKFTLKTQKEVRVRFAPSPTGYFHIGSARTALFNYLFARNRGGALILRIEDTDKERSKPEFEEDIVESLKWLGIEWDEGPHRQSNRKKIYKAYIERLLKEGKAYYCFCTPEELEAKKQEQMSRGEAPMYSGPCSKFSEKEVEERMKKGDRSIIRFKVPRKKVSFNDLVRGKVEFDTSLIGDVSIAKDLDTPLYNLTVVVDDYEMKISHVIRGEDLMPNTPKQILIQEALGFPKPEYAHLPLILGTDRSKLSKREGATSLRDYRDQGYLPEALVNFLAFLGWNPGTEKEIFSMNTLIKEFSLEKVQKSGAVFNIDKLTYLNGFYIRHLSLDKLTELCLPYLIKEGIINPTIKDDKVPATFGGSVLSYEYTLNDGSILDMEYLKGAISLYQERLKKLSEIGELIDYFFKDKLEYEGDLLIWKKSDRGQTKEVLDKMLDLASKSMDLEKEIMDLAERIGDRGTVLWPLRVALSGKKASAGPLDIIKVLGKEKVLKRLREAKELL